MRESTLGEICEFKYGKNLPAKNRVEGAYPVFGSNGQVGSHVEAITRAPTIVVGRKGSVGELHYSCDPCWPIDTTYYVDPSTSEADLRWLYHTMKSLRLHELNKAAAVPGLNRNDAYQQKILVPDLEDQRRIAAILDKADSARSKGNQELEMIDNLLRSAFLERFGSPQTNRKGIARAPIKQLARVVTGNTPPRKDLENYGNVVEWIKSDNINTPEHFLTPAAEHLSDVGRSLGRIAPVGSTLVTCIAGSPSVIGNAALADREVAFNQQINAVIPKDDTDPYFLYCQFLVGKPLVQASSTNSMKGMVSKGRFQQIEFLRPSQDDQEEFGRVFVRTIGLSNYIRTKCAESDALFSALSQRAFRGEL